MNALVCCAVCRHLLVEMKLCPWWSAIMLLENRNCGVIAGRFDGKRQELSPLLQIWPMSPGIQD